MGDLPRFFSLRLAASGSEDDIARMLASPSGTTDGSNTRMKAALRLAAKMSAVEALGPEGALLQQLLQAEFSPLLAEVRNLRAEVLSLRGQLAQVRSAPPDPGGPPAGQRFDSTTVDEA